MTFRESPLFNRFQLIFTVLTGLSFLFPFGASGQTKKEQIERLVFQIDSLKSVVSEEDNLNKSIVGEIRNKENTYDKAQNKNDSLTNLLSIEQTRQTELISKVDSIRIVISSIENELSSALPILDQLCSDLPVSYFNQTAIPFQLGYFNNADSYSVECLLTIPYEYSDIGTKLLFIGPDGINSYSLPSLKAFSQSQGNGQTLNGNDYKAGWFKAAYSSNYTYNPSIISFKSSSGRENAIGFGRINGTKYLISTHDEIEPKLLADLRECNLFKAYPDLIISTAGKLDQIHFVLLRNSPFRTIEDYVNACKEIYGIQCSVGDDEFWELLIAYWKCSLTIESCVQELKLLEQLTGLTEHELGIEIQFKNYPKAISSKGEKIIVTSLDDVINDLLDALEYVAKDKLYLLDYWLKDNEKELQAIKTLPIDQIFRKEGIVEYAAVAGALIMNFKEQGNEGK